MNKLGTEEEIHLAETERAISALSFGKKREEGQSTPWVKEGAEECQGMTPT